MASRKPHASMVHPGVMALGKKKRTTFFRPRKSARLIAAPVEVVPVNSGAACPTSGSESAKGSRFLRSVSPIKRGPILQLEDIVRKARVHLNILICRAAG